MLEIYHAPRTRGYRVIWICEELGVPYQIVPVDMSPAYRGSASWRSMSPTGKVPVLNDDGFVMFESCAMAQYALAKYGEGQLEPNRGTPEYGLYLQWSWFSEATFARPLGEIVNHRRAFGDAAQDEIIAEMAQRARVCANAVDGALEGKNYLLGNEFSAADIMLGYTLKTYQALLDEPLPSATNRYWQTLTARAAFQATEKADRGQP